MTSQDRLIPIGPGNLKGSQPRGVPSLASMGDDIVTEKWPVWLRLVVIVGLSASLWACIIFAVLALVS